MSWHQVGAMVFFSSSRVVKHHFAVPSRVWDYGAIGHISIWARAKDGFHAVKGERRADYRMAVVMDQRTISLAGLVVGVRFWSIGCFRSRRRERSIFRGW